MQHQFIKPSDAEWNNYVQQTAADACGKYAGHQHFIAKKKTGDKLASGDHDNLQSLVRFSLLLFKNKSEHKADQSGK
jgi:hypothetical protein